MSTNAFFSAGVLTAILVMPITAFVNDAGSDHLRIGWAEVDITRDHLEG